MPLHHGSCHCGAVRFTVEGDLADPYTCDCSLCHKKNAVMASVRESRLKLVAGEDKLSVYRWNTRVAQHYFCSVCGIYPFHRKRSMPDHYGVNLNALDDFDATALSIRKAEGKGMTVEPEGAREEWPGPRVK